MNYKKLIAAAFSARQNAYAPYSEFKVGAALLCEDGSVYLGCNIENASFGATVCAERMAVFKAVSDGKNDFCALAVVGAKDGTAFDYCPPCGICRQVLREFCKDDFQIVTAKSEDDYKVATLAELFPAAFVRSNL